MFKQNILVTGGCGFIGSNLVNKLVNLGHNVFVIDRVLQQQNVKATYYKLNLIEFEDCLPLFKNIDVVFHLASEVSIKFCNENPKDCLNNNTVITTNVLECCRINKIKLFVFSSTAALYKQNKNNSCKETDPTDTINSYSLSKLYGEQLCSIYFNMYNINTICLRYFNVYGNNILTSKYSSVLNNFLYNSKHNLPICINGDGTQTRDFVHVEDVVNANISCLNVNSLAYGQVFNIGTGSSISIIEIATTLSNNIVYVSSVPGEIKHSKANIVKAKKILKWKPVNKLVSWLKNYK